MNTTLKTKKSRLPFLALALALSAGTVGGMLSIAAMTEPAMARGNGGGGGAGGDGGGANIMNPGNPPNANVPGRGPNARVMPDRPTCDEASRPGSIRDCRYTPARSPRVVNIHGFANCAVVSQVIGANGVPQFVCVRTM
jgi:hypothetical protein